MRIMCALVAAIAWQARAEAPQELSLSGVDSVMSLPYGFWNESFGLAGAYVRAVRGYPQPQATMLSTIMAGTEGSAMGLVMAQNIRVFGIERLFFDPIVSIGYFSDIEAYIDGNPGFPDERAGSNESHSDNFVRGDGSDDFFRFRLKYLLPIGTGRHQVVTAYEFREGLLTGGATGAAAWNPLVSGRTFLELRPFYRTQNVRNRDFDLRQSTNGAELDIFWDNRDYPANPSRGNALTVQITRDWGLASSTESWSNVSFEYDQYWTLGTIKGFRQSVIAVDFWTSYSPTWQALPEGRIKHRPPAFRGATLGGAFRMRAYPSQRFSDKAAVYYAAELRLTPTWNFFERLPSIQDRVGVEWLQIVGFAEFGRVAPHHTVRELHRDMRWDAGGGLRVGAKGIVGRFDIAYSNEGMGVQMMIGHPFQF